MASTAGDSRAWLLLTGLGLAAVVQPLGCGPVVNDEGLNDTTLTAVDQALADVGPKVVYPSLQLASEAFGALDEAVLAWQSADASGKPAALDSARAAFVDAVHAWQFVEVMQIGPAASALTAIAGEDVRDAVYSWPTVNPCRVDQVTAKVEYADDAFATANVNVLGLDALEHLLYAPTDANACPGQVDINMNGTWDALGEDGVVDNRAAYAVVLTEALDAHALDLVDAWDPQGEDFGSQLAAYGTADSPYETYNAAFNAIFDAIFYVETRVKDRKVAPALGLRDCTEDACIDGVEFQLAHLSVPSIEANLLGARMLFTGGDGAGLDDVLTAAGAGDEAQEILDALDAAELAAEALTVPLDETAIVEKDAGLALHAALTLFTDVFKADVAPLLSLTIPAEAAGDND